ncbi:hypothetical protein [Streptomyces sp. NPDC087294]|uniref:hypothetical protein n=1 Tax=Streptomyces sp. NPDC087294 TaxID=3365777 RepID=UPI00382178D0
MNTDRPDHDDESGPEDRETAVSGATPSEADVPGSAVPEADADADADADASKADVATAGVAEADAAEAPDVVDVTPVAHAVAASGALTTRPPRRWSPVLIASVAAAVLLAGGGGAYFASSASGGGRAQAGSAADDSTPPPLALDGYAPATSRTNGIAAGEPNPYGVHYRAAGELPAGPKSASVYAARGEVTQAEVARLAKALGLDGTPVTQGESWQVGSAKDGSGPTLTVDKAAPGSWIFHRYATGTDRCEGTLACAKGPANPAGDTVGEAAAKKAAAPVLKALGQDGAKVDASQVMGAQRVVNADPVVGGLPTSGWTTGLTVSASGELVGGTGRLKTPVEGDTYPVLSAAKTLALMNKAPATDPRMGIGGCASAVPLKDELEQPCGSAASPSGANDSTVTVERAVLGLAERTRLGQPVLVPSWLFEVRGSAARGAFTATYPAVDPAYLTSATPSPEPTASGSAAPEDVKVNGYAVNGRELTVGFTGGVCADYKATAKESSGSVTVTVTETPWKGKVCVMIAKELQQKVRLDEPLGDRKVVGTGGKAIPALKSGERLSETSEAR